MNTSREVILARVQANQPARQPLPTVPRFEGDATADKFAAVLESIGGRVVRLPDATHLAATVQRLFPADSHSHVASILVPANVSVDATTSLPTLAAVDLAVLLGEVGVAENGTVWLPEANMLHRALPTITQHLVLVLDQRNLVATMHQAYARLRGVGGYGVFLAGPSKTADIEQSLVIGAHGARSLTVLLY